MKPERARAALAGGALGACIVGLTGVDAGILWIVTGVFTLRSVTRSAPGLAWGIACMGVGLRWGSFAVGDLETATRLFGATVIAGGPVARIGMTAALAGAVMDEARRGGLRADSWVDRGAALVALVVLVPLFLVEGASSDPILAGVWAVAAAATLLAGLALHPVAKRLPSWVPLPVVVAGVAAAVVAA
ncbi:MAG: hypothetical protein ACRDKJ_01695 [Actinomycetota bacterium]